MTTAQQQPARRIGASAGSLLRVAAVAAMLLPALVAVSASSADAASYRYWSFWTANASGSWTYSNVGAASTRPNDGDVQGWRFAVSTGANSSTIAPRTAGSLDALCAGQPPVADKKRVGLVVDFGTRADAPPGEAPPTSRTFCVLAPVKASGASVLLQALSARTKDGLVCGINGYPRTECAVVVTDARPSATPDNSPETTQQPAAPNRRPSPVPRTTVDSSAAPPSTTKATPSTTTAPPPRTPSSAAVGAADPRASATPTVVTDAAPASASGSTGSPLGVFVAVALLALAAGSAFLLRRRAS
jgi:hypothetical protein